MPEKMKSWLGSGNGRLDAGQKSSLAFWSTVSVSVNVGIEDHTSGPRKGTLSHGKATSYLFTSQLSFELGQNLNVRGVGHCRHVVMEVCTCWACPLHTAMGRSHGAAGPLETSWDHMGS